MILFQPFSCVLPLLFQLFIPFQLDLKITEEHFGFQTFQYSDDCRTCDKASSGFYKHCRSLNIQLWGFDSDTVESV